MRQGTKLAVVAGVAVAAIFIYVYLHPTGSRPGISSRMAPTHSYRLVNTYPHDPDAFTQGLVFEDGFLYEGTGRKGQSSLRKVDLETGEVLQIHNLSDEYFGEGITIYNDKIIQITYGARKGFVYDLATFDQLEEFPYTTHGWGLTHDGKRLIMSDGTSMLQFLDPESFQQVGQVMVKDGDEPVIALNELEYIDGEIYANVWHTDLIARISPRTGQVKSWIDLTGLNGNRIRYEDAEVLNGIAYDQTNNRLFVTGKLWPYLFEIEVVKEPLQQPPNPADK